MSKFVHLRVHSTYSIREGLLFPNQIVDWARNTNSPALALTDTFNMHAAVDFYHQAKGAGIHPITGLELGVYDNFKSNGKDGMHNLSYKLVLLAKNTDGYKNLMLLSTQALTQSAKAGENKTTGSTEEANIKSMAESGYVDRDFLIEHSAGLLILSGASQGDVGLCLAENNIEQASRRVSAWMEVFGDNYYLELQKLSSNSGHGEAMQNKEKQQAENELNLATIQLAKQHKCPPIATNNAMFLSREDYEAHRIRVNINRGEITGEEETPHSYTEEQYLKTPEEMAELFADCPEAIENTFYAAQRCGHILETHLKMPKYPSNTSLSDDSSEEDSKTTEAEQQSDGELLETLSRQGLANQLGENWQELNDGAYKKRLKLELDVINRMNYNGYFLIVCNFVNWAKDNNIAIGPGRGSGGASLVAYATGITGLDPVEHKLIFERFLNEGRGSMPDFDIDVCMRGRDRVVQYLQDTFGKQKTLHIAAFSTMASKGAIRDVARVLGKAYGLANKLAEMVPSRPGTSLDDALSINPALKNFLESDKDAKLVFNWAKRIEGQVRNTTVHAAGLMIAPENAEKHCPIFRDEDGKYISQYAKDDLEKVGLVKFDVLGLRNLTIIDDTAALLKETDGIDLKMDEVAWDDEKTMKSVCDGLTYAVFQLDSSGMREVAKLMQPKTFNDIAALIALYRPGPMDLIPDFVANKRKIERGERIEYPDDVLEDILLPTYGVAVYQEQIMKIARRLSGFDMIQADIVRAAMSKKDKKMMADQRAAFIKGAMKEQDYDEAKANEMFDIIAEFAGYGFNHAHSVGYGILAYWTAYLKANYPAHYMAACMTNKLGGIDKLPSLAEECRRIKVSLRPPDINHSRPNFAVIKQDDKYYVDFSLSSIKGIGDASAAIIDEERSKGEFTSFFDFCSRISPQHLSRKLLENLISAGCFSSLDDDYASLYHSIDHGLQLSETRFQEKTSGLGDMFVSELDKKIIPKHKNTSFSRWSSGKLAREEKRALGFNLRHDVFQVYKKELRNYVSTAVSALHANDEALICGRIYGAKQQYREVKDRRVRSYTWQLIDDTDDIMVVCDDNALNNREATLRAGDVVVVAGKVIEYDDNRSFSRGGKLGKRAKNNGAKDAKNSDNDSIKANGAEGQDNGATDYYEDYSHALANGELNNNLANGEEPAYQPPRLQIQEKKKQPKQNKRDSKLPKRRLFRASKIYDIGDMRIKNCKAINVSVEATEDIEDDLGGLESHLYPYRDSKGIPISLRLVNPVQNWSCNINIMRKHKFLPSNIFMQKLEEVLPNGEISLN